MRSIHLHRIPRLGSKLKMNVFNQLKVSLFWILTIFTVIVITNREYEEKFVDLYGNDNETSGKWEPVRKIWPDLIPLWNYSLHVHYVARMSPQGNLSMVLLQKRVLTFINTTYEDMDIDILIYGIEGHYKFKKVPYWYYLAKGLQPDCVFYLAQEDDEEELFSLWEHVCGVTVLTPPEKV